MEVISVKDLRKKFGWFLSRRKVIALDGLSFEVPDNVIYGFLGPNGAGKTTTIKVLLGLIMPDGGESRIFNMSSTDKDVRDKVGFLPDNPTFYNHLTAREFLGFCGKLIHLGRMERAKRSSELIDKMKLTKQADQKIEGFSRGQLQRLGIAQALMNNPELIILDEPITGLDPMGRREVKQIMQDLKDEGKTVFFSSHILSDVEQMCDMISIINRGRLVDHGSCDELLGDQGVEIWTENVDQSAIAELEKMSSSVVIKDGNVGFILNSSENKEELIKRVNEKGGSVRETIAKKEDLESFFLRRVEEDDIKRDQ
ncbi:MAG: ABC transporter ATP-binding protein [Planctomycetota bacterium]